MKNRIIIVFLVFSIFFISIGFASLNTELSISGDAYIHVGDDILITKIEMVEASLGGFETYNAVVSNKEVSMFVTLPNNDSKITYKIEIINYSAKKYLLNKIEITNTNENVRYKIDNLEEQDVFLNNKKSEIFITFYKDESLNEDSTTFNIKLNFEVYLDSEPNVPVLANNMIAVYYDYNDSAWKKADSSNVDINYGWYNYRKKLWANAVTVNENKRNSYLKADFGTTINLEDINTMWVWIPRFNAITPSDFNGGTKDLPGEINVSFTTSGMNALDSFTFGNQSLSGFWVAKFENSATILPTEIDYVEREVVIKPGVAPWTSTNLNTFFNSIVKMKKDGNIYGFDLNANPSLDTHLIKNNEWGAIAYLVNSKYGRCNGGICEDIRMNNCKIYKTGVASDNNSNWNSSLICDVLENQYDGSVGVNASTTGNVYGIYDLSGGVNEYVMGSYIGNLGNSGFSELPEDKYLNTYSSYYLGHALQETKNWYNDYSEVFVSAYSDKAWLVRGGFANDRTLAGVYYWMASGGEANANRGVRSVLTLN